MTVIKRTGPLSHTIRVAGAAAVLLTAGLLATPAHADTPVPAGTPGFHLCGAVLWSANAGVTAAHCLEGRSAP
ncbi:hypothetical protein ACN20G_29710 (plasmid) [Streptomyces sp. BI20]|uniref:hypothetical protein n=1 Tax=Streptomyces sp. BI20 TaxID=3403460 RepID=UPI003C72590E